MLNHMKRGLALHAKGMVYVMVNALPWGGGQLSLLKDATPAVVNGDLMVAPPITAPDNFPLVVLSTGVPIIYSAGDVTGQEFPFDVYDWSLRAWYGQVMEYVNNHAPVMVNDQPQTIYLARDLPMAPLDIAALCIDYEADTLVISTGDSLPPGLVLVGGVLSGMPYTPGSYDINFTASDPAGGVLVYPLFTFVISSTGGAVIDQTITIAKIKAGTPGPPGTNGTGADGYSLNLSRESFTVYCYAEGTPVDPTLAGASGQLTVYKGTADDTAAASLSATGTGCTGTINSSDNYPVAAHPKGYYQVTAITTDSASLNITAIVGGATIIRTFTISKARGGYEIVATLPVSNLFTGRMVFLLSDKKLYRYTGTAWTAAVAATDVTGQLTDAQLASIAAAKLTGQITSTQITDGAISTPKLAAGAVEAANIAADTITADKIAARTITAVNIEAGAIGTYELAGHAVTADKLSAGEIISASAQIGTGVILAANIGNLQVGTAQLANASITNAKIGSLAVKTGNIDDLNVTTLKIAGNAVTVPSAAYAANNSGGDLTCTVTTSGGQLHIIFGANTLNPTTSSQPVHLDEDATLSIATLTPIRSYWGGSDRYAVSGSFAIMRLPGAGSHTYKVRSTAALVDLSILVLEVKK